MSQFGLLLVTDESTIREACRGWVPPGEKVTKTITNPFTGEPAEVTSQTPPGVDESLDCASLDEVHQRLKDAQPVAIDFQLDSVMQSTLRPAAEPFLYGYHEEGVVILKQILEDFEPLIAILVSQQLGGSPLGKYADATARRQDKLSMFLLVYSF
jgi:hypothetical protein